MPTTLSPPSLLLLLSFAHLASLASCTDIFVENKCRYSVDVGIIYSTDDTSGCDYVKDFNDGSQPICVKYWYQVSGGSRSFIIGGIKNSCIYLTAMTAASDGKLFWPTSANCPNACEHDLEYYSCANAPSKTNDCYYWHQISPIGTDPRKECAPEGIDYTWTIDCDGDSALTPKPKPSPSPSPSPSPVLVPSKSAPIRTPPSAPLREPPSPLVKPPSKLPPPPPPVPPVVVAPSLAPLATIAPTPSLTTASTPALTPSLAPVSAPELAPMPSNAVPFGLTIDSSIPLDATTSTKSSNAGVIAGAVIAGVAAVGLIIAGGVFLVRRKNVVLDERFIDPEKNTNAAKPTPSNVSDSAFKSQSSAAADHPSSMLGLSGAPHILAVDPVMSYIQNKLSKQAVTRTERGLKSHLEAWQINFMDITIEYLIGEGSFGKVYKGKWKHTDVAVKILMESASINESSGQLYGSSSNLMEPSPALMAKLNEEAQIMEKLHHPNTAQFMGICSSPAALVIEYCARGSLNSVLNKGLTDQSGAAAAELTWNRRVNIAMDTVRGMLNLHGRVPPILHRDLKSPNILICASWTAKITDFNLSKILEDTAHASSHAAMNPRWLAPEILDGQPASLASDVFSFGVCMWELLTWRIPWGSSNPWGIVSAITNGTRLEIPSKTDLPGPQSGDWVHLDSYIQLMQRCCAQDPASRPSFEEIGNELQQMT